MRLARWGRSPYETDADMAAEAQALGELVDVVEGQQDAEIVVIHSQIQFAEAELAIATSLELLITTTSGTDHIDRVLMAQRGIEVVRLPEARRDAVVDATIGMLIWGLRRMGAMQEAARDGQWVRSQLPDLAPVGVRGARIGVVGLGVIGQRVAQVLRAMGADVVGCDPAGIPPTIEAMTIQDMVSSCAAMTLHCDLNPTSVGMVSDTLLGSMRAGLVLVNTARGGLVDVDAALQALELGHLGALCLDVFPTEPWPDMASTLSHPRLLLLPHAAGYHTGLSGEIRRGLYAAVDAFKAERTPPHQVQSPVS